MNLLVVTQYFWPENFRINDLVSGLVERGHTVTVLTGLPNYPEGVIFEGYRFFQRRSQKYCGARVLRVPLLPRGKGGAARLALNYVSFALTASLWGPFLCRGKFDAIVVCQLSPATVGLPGLVMKVVKRAPILFWVLDLWPESLSATGAVTNKKALAVVDAMMRGIYRKVDKIVVSSRSFVTSISSKGIPAASIGHLPNWNEPEYTCASSSNSELPSLPTGFKIMFAGNIGAAQSFGTILHAAGLLREYGDIHWIILGDGRKADWVKDEVLQRGLGESVHLLGRYPQQTMPAFFAEADVMLVSLAKDPIFALTVPGKIQSYLVCGKPIIGALDGEGARLIEESGAGIAVAAEDPVALADAVKRMYEMNGEARREMGLRGKEFALCNFDREMLIHRVEEWLHELVADAAPSPKREM